ncbi:lysine N(6)-hydroxylase/L-ornithine N(5)-oxygenase family protein [Mycolicibacterium canariasense]|uniref:lysine N(6)-hydroxylase/L-ornithine N(5)-oxygenase family protein n=1 Tax=Mycolicibacterium canariasense TaxID=228230 RepID=UPI000788FA8A|nr:SidA/IucD/PvdA family monooxygenase [Mycolicibacterium canariasense]MCV7210066.1 lysine N(6)-hydroxylase/L-ornithine N(5)-oxygenase family protein [Mycolicibacterium canariasense]ORV04738.1 L-lysine 6-monooxygenase [Mycolicibacterium canariasense]
MLGIGFGPANLALAIALAERGEHGYFLEAQPRFGWHRDMLLPGTRMQIPFLKDLVTLRNTKSDFTFVNYLSERGRLVEFIGRHDVFPSRLEFHDYLDWAAAHFAADVRYGQRVVGVARGPGGGFTVRTQAGVAVEAERLVLGMGLKPVLPNGVRWTSRCFHSHGLLGALARLGAVRSVAVVGAGQSAAEVVAHLYRSGPQVQVHAVFGRYGYSLADDSAFVNGIFDPAAVDEFFGADEPVRRRLLEYHRSANYSAVDVDLIEQLYGQVYEERVSGQRRLFLHRASEIAEAAEHAEGVRVTVRSLVDRHEEMLHCDAVIYATGYAPTDVAAFLGALATDYEFDEHGLPVVTRDYRLAGRPGAAGDIFLNGSVVEHTHGLGATLLSNVAVRGGEIAAAITHPK